MNARTFVSPVSPQWRKTLMASALAVSLGGAIIAGKYMPSAFADQHSAVDVQSVDRSGFPGSFADLVETVKPAVVNISISGSLKTKQFSMPDFEFPDDSEMGEFFRRFFERSLPHDSERQMRSLGSGFIIDAEGYVVTNNHVVKDADEITVVLDNGDKLEAEVIGTDKKTDLALLKVESDEPLPYIKFGDSDASRIGDWVIAIGNPFGLGGTTTTGIISARGRDINAGPLDDFIQVDAPINRGNSGGPLFNTDGDVIGINTAIYSPNGGSVGIGFAIPSNQAQHVIAQIKDKGFVERGWLGVYIQDVSDEIAESLGLDDDDGALVTRVMPDSPAATAGLEAGDVIMRYNGEAVTRMRSLPHMVANTAAGDKVDLEIWRDGKTMDLQATIGTSDEKEIASSESNEDAAETGQLGLALANLTDEVRQRYRIDEEISGVVITDVEPGSSASRKGIRRGDVITKVGGEKVSSVDEAIAAVNQTKSENGKAVLMLIHRDGNDRFVALRFS